jgi:Lipase (class 2)
MTRLPTARSLACILVVVAAAAGPPGCVDAPDDAPGPLASTVVQHVVFDGPSVQFAGGFHPPNAPEGGFGGGACTATRTPVVFVHGNSVNATFFARPSSSGVPSVYDTLKAAGYNDCELFGITYLSAGEQATRQLNYHTSVKAARIRDFITAVKAYTGKPRVHVIAHSLGVTVALHGITFGNQWDSIASFINVAGGLKGLSTCLAVGFANPAWPTCGSQNLFDANIFGFWPDGAAGASNPRTGSSASIGFRREPERRPAVRFFTISGGTADTTVSGDQSRFTPSPAVKAQIDVAIDHLSSFSDTGAIMSTMLGSSCTGTACCAGYTGTCSNL